MIREELVHVDLRLISDTVVGARVSANLCSLVETAQASGSTASEDLTRDHTGPATNVFVVTDSYCNISWSCWRAEAAVG